MALAGGIDKFITDPTVRKQRQVSVRWCFIFILSLVASRSLENLELAESVERRGG
jgi:hypothetical protein